MYLRRLSYLLICSLAMLSARAQCPSYKNQFEFIANYSRLTAPELAANNNEATQLTHQETANTGADFVSVRYFLYSCLSVGMTGGYQRQQGNKRERYGYEYMTVGNYTTKTVTVAVELSYIYRIRKYMDIYTYAGTGPAATSTTTTGISSVIGGAGKEATEKGDAFVFHYCPLGIRVGGRIGGFAELGYGYKGLFSCGLSVRPGRRWCSRK